MIEVANSKYDVIHKLDKNEQTTTLKWQELPVAHINNCGA